MAHHFDERKLVGAFAADNKDVACLQVSTMNVNIFNGTLVYRQQRCCLSPSKYSECRYFQWDSCIHMHGECMGREQSRIGVRIQHTVKPLI